MLLIRDRQMEALRQAARQSFVRSLVDDARRELPGLCRGRALTELLALFDAAVGRAEGFGISAPDGQALIARLALAHGLLFDRGDELDWTRPLLESAALSGSSKLVLLLGRLPARLRPENLSRELKVE